MDTEKIELKKKLTKQEGWLSIFVNILLFALKYWAGVVSGSLALIADAWHTLSDSISSIFVLVSARFSFKEPDDDHPFGHGRFELVTSIFIGILLVIVGLSFVKESIEKFISREDAVYGTVAIVVTVISILFKEGLAQFAMHGYRKTESEALKADAWHHRSDAISSVVILVGIFIGKYFWWIDSLLGIIVAFFLLYAAYEIIKQSVSIILGEGASVEVIDKVKKIAYLTAQKEIYLHHIHYHNYVLHKEITFHICLPQDYTIKEAHHISSKIESAIRKKMGIHATIHIDPLKNIPRELV